MNEFDEMPSEALRKTISEILDSESVFQGQTGEQLQVLLSSLVGDFADDPQLKTRLLSETKTGFGMALGKFLAWKLWTDFEKSDKLKSDQVREESHLRIRLPSSVRTDVKEGWREVAQGFRDKTGLSLPEAVLEPDPQSELDWTILWRGGFLLRFRPSENWTQTLPAALSQVGARFLNLEKVKNLVEGVKQGNPTLAEELDRIRMPLSTIFGVMQNLLEEGVPVAPLEVILSTLALNWERIQDRPALLSAVRKELSPWICQTFEGPLGHLRVLAIGPLMANQLNNSLRYLGVDSVLALEPKQAALIAGLLRQTIARFDGPKRTALLVDQRYRPGLNRLMRPIVPELKVLSRAELHRGIPIEVVATVDLKAAPEPATNAQEGQA